MDSKIKEILDELTTQDIARYLYQYRGVSESDYKRMIKWIKRETG